MKKIIAIMTLACLATSPLKAQTSTTAQTPGNESADMPEGMKVTENDLMRDYNNRTNLSSSSTPVRNLPYDDKILEDRLSRIPTIIELPLNEVTRKYIDTYASRMKRSVSVMLGSSNFYNPIFEEALERHELPLELKYLPVIESGLRPNATSSAGAAGLWQFILAAGKQYGLEINTLVDERRDPIKSSEAAARYLSDLYNSFGDWSLAIAAYNCGPGTVQKALLRAGTTKENADFWAIYDYLPHETRGYVPAFIAATYIMNYYCEHGITPMSANFPAESDTIVVSRDARFASISSVCNVTVDELRSLNPQYRHDIVPRDYAVRLPSSAIENFITKEDQIYGSSPATVPETTEEDANAVAVTTVPTYDETPVQTQVEEIAQTRVEVPVETQVEEIAQTQIEVPVETQVEEVAQTQVEEPVHITPVQPVTQTQTSVQPENTQTQLIAEVKPLDSQAAPAKVTPVVVAQDNAQKAQPAAAAKPANNKQAATQKNNRWNNQQTAKKKKPQQPRTKSVEVQSGDNLTKIARQNGTTVENLRKLNNIKGSTIRPGQKIRVK